MSSHIDVVKHINKTKCTHNIRRDLCIKCSPYSFLKPLKNIKNIKPNVTTETDEQVINVLTLPSILNSSTVPNILRLPSISTIKKRKRFICTHNIRNDLCKICSPFNFCQHNIWKYHCKLCKGSSICEHNIIKYYCKICGSKNRCIHERIRKKCKECKNSSMNSSSEQIIQPILTNINKMDISFIN